MKFLLVPSGGISAVDELSTADTLRRCKKGLQIWKEGNHDKLLVSGGIFNPRAIQTKPAGKLMADWFISHGVKEKDLIIEDRSLDTFQNVKFAVELLKDYKNPEITVVTQFHHTFRFWITFFFVYGIRIKRQPVHYSLS